MDERVQSHGERLATVEGALSAIAASLDRFGQMSEDIHSIKATMEAINRRLDEGSRNFERHEESAREFERRVVAVEFGLSEVKREIFGDGRDYPGLRSTVLGMKSAKDGEAGMFKTASVLATYGAQGIWAIALAASAFVASHLMWK
jgi:hypothetical protein